MAYTNKRVHNRVTGQAITFVRTASDSNGRLLEMVATYGPQSTEPLAHYHPRQAEDFEVLSGELCVRLDGKLITLHKGDKIHIAPNQVHSMWNGSHNPTQVNWQVQPAMDTEFLLETITGLANDGKVDQKGSPSLLQTALTGNKFSDVLRFAKPPFLVQKILFTLLTPVAYLMGLRATYQKYLK